MNRWRSFLVVVAVIFGLSYGGLLVFAASPAYCAFTTNIADTAPCFKYAVRDVDADVLLVGDSSLLYAIRPSEVAAAGGPSSYNYGMVGPAFALDPAGVIDHYLATNRKPRAIVVYFSPWDKVEPGRITDPRWIPAATLVLQHGGLRDIARLLAARPLAPFEIPPTVAQSVSLDQGRPRTRRLAMESDGGHLDFANLNDVPLPPLEGRCTPPDPPVPVTVSERTRRALAGLRDRYAAQGIRVLVYVAPSAACDRVLGQTRAAYAGVADNVPLALPDRFFTADSSHTHTHVNVDGANLSSQLLARFLAARLPELAAR